MQIITQYFRDIGNNITDVIKALEEIGENLVNWFLNNEMKLKTDNVIYF